MVTRTVKYSLGVLGVLVVALLIAPFFIDVESYKPQIVKAIQDATGRKAEIGKIEASVFPWVGVRLEDVHLSNRQGFSDHDFLKVESLDIKVALLPLLSKEIEVKQFRLVSPEIFVERNANGEGNWEDLTASDAPATEATGTIETGNSGKKEKPAPLASFNAESLQLTGGRLIFVDDASSGRAEVHDVNVEINDVQLDRPVEMNASAKLGDDAITLNAQVGPIGDIAKLNVGKLPLQATLQADSIGLESLAGILPQLPDTVGKLENSKIRLNVKVEQRPNGLRLTIGDMAFVGSLTAESHWKAEMSGGSTVRLQECSLAINSQPLLNARGEIWIGSKLKYQLRIEGEAIEREWLTGLMPELGEMYAKHPAPWQQVKLGALIAGDTGRLELRDLQLMLDKDLVQASGVVSFDKAPDIRLRLSANDLHADPWLPQPKKKKKQPATVESELANASVSAGKDEPDLRAFARWRISSQMQIEALHLRGMKLEHLRATLNGNHGKFALDPLRFDLSGGQVTENATLNLAEYPARWTESVHMVDVSIGPVLKALAGMNMLEGTLQMDTDLKAVGLLPDNSMRSLSGKGKVLLTDGSVKGFDIASTLRHLTAPGQASGSEKTDFSQMQASFTIKKGVVKNDDLFMASPLFRLSGNGIVDLPKGALDYHVKPKLVGTLVGQGDTVTVRKGLAVPLHIRGPFNGLKVTPEIDPKTLIENIGAGKGGNVLKGLKEALTDGDKQPQENKEPEPQQPTPQQLLQERLKGLGF